MFNIWSRSTNALATLMCCVALDPTAWAADSADFLAKFNEPIVLPAKSFGTDKLDMAPPDAGYYSCRRTQYNTKPPRFLMGDDINNTIYVGFNMYADGTVRLRLKDKTFDEGVFHWMHNPKSGRVAFTDGPLSKLFSWPIHLSTWWLTDWFSRLAIDPPNDPTGLTKSVTCTNRDRLIPIEN
jgi:hypothetical protein